MPLERRRRTPALARLAAQRPPKPPPPRVENNDAPPIGEVIRAVLARVTDPPRFSHARGIVTAAGGKTLLTNAYVLFRLLRHVGCRLPIECWQLPHERDPVWQALVEPLGVTIVDARSKGFIGNPFAGSNIMFKGKYGPYRRDQLDGYSLKAFSLQWCDFREALFLDSDNCPVQNVTTVFDWPEYRTGPGFVLWPDFDQPANPGFALPIMSTFGLPELSETHTLDAANGCETGQILVDKTRLHNWSALHLATWFSEHAKPFYEASYGEKDCNQPACRWAGFEPTIIPHASQLDKGVCVQMDFQGTPLFFHRFSAAMKWGLRGPQIEPEGFPHQSFCLRALAELRDQWPTPRSA